MKDQAQGLRELAARVRGQAPPAAAGDGPRVLAVTSGKGGAGKTNLVANLGTVLARRGLRVAVLDADFGLANLDILLNLHPTRNLGHLVRGEARPEEVAVEAAPGFRVIPGASGVAALADLDPEGREALLAQLAPLTADRDFLLVDTAAGIGRNVVDLCRAADELVLVTTPEPTSLTDAYGLLKVVWGRPPRVPARVVVNVAASVEEGRGVYEKFAEVVARFLGGELSWLGAIPRDEHVGRAARRQTPFAAAYPRCPASRAVEAVADALAGPRPPAPRAGFWQRLLAGVSGHEAAPAGR